MELDMKKNPGKWEDAYMIAGQYLGVVGASISTTLGSLGTLYLVEESEEGPEFLYAGMIYSLISSLPLIYVSAQVGKKLGRKKDSRLEEELKGGNE